MEPTGMDTDTIESAAIKHRFPPEGGQRGNGAGLSLRTKFLLGIGIILLWFCSLCALLVYLQEKFLLEDTAHAKSQIVLAAVEATQGYVRDILRPRMYEILGHDSFVIEAMSTSFIGRAVMERFNTTMPEYQYRRVAVNARNPASEANAMDRRLIERFRLHPEEDSWQGIVKADGESFFMRYRPVYFDDTCLHCHGEPAAAPAMLLDRYGAERGFHHKAGDLAGVSSVGIPVDVALAQIKEKALSVFIAGFLFASVIFLTISFFFNRVVVHDLRGLLEIFRETLRGDEEFQSLDVVDSSRDEIGALRTVARSMAVRLRDTHRQLEENALDLERKVDERTRALRESESLLHDKVLARNRELQTLNALAELTTQATGLQEVLTRALRQTLKLIPAEGAGLYLIVPGADGTRLELQCRESAPQLAPSVAFEPDLCRSVIAEMTPDLPSSLCEAACGHVSLFAEGDSPGYLTIPLCCRGKVLGVMTFSGRDFEEITPEQHELLFSIGRQIGIAVESLQSMAEIRQSKDLLQSVFDGITDVVVLLDRESRVKMVNRAYVRRHGLPEPASVLGRPWRHLHPDETAERIAGGMARAFASRTPLTEETRGPSGEILEVYYYPILGDTGEVESIVRYARDITQQKQVEDQIQKTEKLASLGQLAAGVAHEINNPLGVILCYTDLLKRQMGDLPQGMRDLGTIEKHALTCKRIVSDLLKFARSQATRKAPASINQSIAEVVDMIEGQFRKQQVEIRLDLDPDIPVAEMDADKMKQVYLNLLMNARQAMDARGLIQVRTRFLPDSDCAEIVVHDNGRGIPREILGKVFDPFFSTKSSTEGTGLGLSVSYGIIRDHHGEIRVESEPGKWTRFTILLPLNAKEGTHRYS